MTTRRRDLPAFHLKASEYVSLGYLTQEQFDSYFKFSFVRNPWDRIVSEYTYRRPPVRMGFKTWLFRHLPAIGFSDRYTHIIPQYDFSSTNRTSCSWISWGDTSPCRRTSTRYARASAFPPRPCPTSTGPVRGGRLSERSTTSRSCYAGGSGPWNGDTYPHYSQYYDEKSHEFVAQLYRKDIQAFGYSFESSRSTSRLLVR